MDNMVLLSFAYTFLSTFAVSHVLPVSGSPAPAGVITPLTKAEITSFKPFSYYANTAYCDPSFTRNWTCGLNCEANPTFEPVASGGDGDKVQFCSYTCSVIWGLVLTLSPRVRRIRSNIGHCSRLASRHRFQQNVFTLGHPLSF